jgi:hypothetical protein
MRTRMKPVLIHVDPKDWPEFQRLCGRRMISKVLRRMVKEELGKAKTEGRI